jgi:hypothetical protein
MMKFVRNLTLAAVAALSLWHAAPAHAASQVLCSGEVTVGTLARRVVNPNTSNAYALNGQGCAVIQQADIGYFLSQGFSQGSQQSAIVFNTGVATGTTNFVIGTLPAGAYIQKIIWNNLTGNAAGNLALGSTSGGVDVVAAVACAANCLAEPTIAKDLFSATAATPLNFSSSAWGSANVNITVVYSYF